MNIIRKVAKKAIAGIWVGEKSGSEVPLNSRSEASAVLRAAEKLGSSIIAEKRL